MGIPGLFKWFRSQEQRRGFVYSKNFRMGSTPKRIVVAVDGHELTFMAAKLHPESSLALVGKMREMVKSIIMQVQRDNPGVAVHGYVAINGVLPKIRLHSRRTRAYVYEAEERFDGEFPKWFMPYEVCSGSNLSRKIVEGFTECEWSCPMRFSSDAVPGESDMKMFNYLKSLGDDTSVVIVGSGSEIYMDALRLAAENPQNKYKMASIQAVTAMRIIDCNASVRNIVASHDTVPVDADAPAFVRDLLLMACVAGGGSIMPRRRDLDMYNGGLDSMIEQYNIIRKEYTRLTIKVRGERIVPASRLIIDGKLNRSMFVDLCQRVAAELPVRSPVKPTAHVCIKACAKDLESYGTMIEWTVSSKMGNVPSWTWDSGIETAPCLSKVSMDMFSAPPLEYGAPMTALEQIIATFPPMMLFHYVHIHDLKVLYKHMKETGYPRKLSQPCVKREVGRGITYDTRELDHVPMIDSASLLASCKQEIIHSHTMDHIMTASA